MSWKTILVPHDFSASANHAAALARDEAKAHGGALVLLHVLDLPHQMPPDAIILPSENGEPITVRDFAMSSAEAHLADLTARLEKDGVTATAFVRIGDPIDEINKFVDEKNIDLIVMGTHGRSGIRRMLAGSVAERVVRSARVPVLTVRHPD